jgi:hypothetical protein
MTPSLSEQVRRVELLLVCSLKPARAEWVPMQLVQLQMNGDAFTTTTIYSLSMDRFT